MNERIKELAERAGFNTADRDMCYHINCLVDSVVQECLKLCKEVEEDLELVPTELEREAAVAGVMFCYDAIKGEFGVK